RAAFELGLRLRRVDFKRWARQESAGTPVEREQETRFELPQTREQDQVEPARMSNQEPEPREAAAGTCCLRLGGSFGRNGTAARNSRGVFLRGRHFRSGLPSSSGLLFTFTGLAASMRLRNLALTTSFIGVEIQPS